MIAVSRVDGQIVSLPDAPRAPEGIAPEVIALLTAVTYFSGAYGSTGKLEAAISSQADLSGVIGNAQVLAMLSVMHCASPILQDGARAVLADFRKACADLETLAELWIERLPQPVESVQRIVTPG